MIARPRKTAVRLLMALLPVQAACVSHQHQPDPATLTASPDCEVINGVYTVDSEEDGRLLAESLFDEDAYVSTLAVEKTVHEVTVRAGTVGGQKLPTAFFGRFTCTDSVLKLILSDEYSADGVFMNASDNVLELFASDERSLNLRFINTTLAFFFIVPYYSSSDKLVTLRKETIQKE